VDSHALHPGCTESALPENGGRKMNVFAYLFVSGLVAGGLYLIKIGIDKWPTNPK